jgi:hypothetical protein
MVQTIISSSSLTSNGVTTFESNVDSIVVYTNLEAACELLQHRLQRLAVVAPCSYHAATTQLPCSYQPAFTLLRRMQISKSARMMRGQLDEMYIMSAVSENDSTRGRAM